MAQRYTSSRVIPRQPQALPTGPQPLGLLRTPGAISQPAQAFTPRPLQQRPQIAPQPFPFPDNRSGQALPLGQQSARRNPWLAGLPFMQMQRPGGTNELLANLLARFR
jgi:hypothetical protein